MFSLKKENDKKKKVTCDLAFIGDRPLNGWSNILTYKENGKGWFRRIMVVDFIKGSLCIKKGQDICYG